MVAILSRFKSLITGKIKFQEPEDQKEKFTNYYQGGYDSFSHFGSGGQKWPGGLSSNGSSPIINHTESRQNGRSVFHGSTQARTLITRKRDVTVDVGLKLEPTPSWEILGITQDAAEVWATDHEQRFDIYMKSKQCHRAETMTGYQLQRLCSLFRNRDNDQFIRYYYSKSKQLMSPVQIDFIDPNQVRGTGWTDTYGFQATYFDGIVRNTSGKEIGYKVWIQEQTKSGIKTKAVEIPARGARSGRIFMSHMFETEYAGQGRGYSPLHYAVQDLENITDFSSAQIKLAINQSGITGFTKPSDEQAASDIFEGLTDSPGPQQATTATTEGVIDTGYEFCMNSIPELNARAPGSNWIGNLDKGETIEFPKQTAPGAQFDNFITSIMTYLASAYSMPLEVVAMKFGQSYSASRAALLMAWATGKIEQADIDADLMCDWWEMWLSEEIAAGRSQCPGWNDPRLKRAWLDHRLQGPPLPSINPRDDRGALEVDLKYGITTPQSAARQINGSNAKSNIAKNIKTFPTMPALPGEVAQEPTDNGDDENG